jgi:hypothetical protein
LKKERDFVLLLRSGVDAIPVQGKMLRR